MKYMKLSGVEPRVTAQLPTVHGFPILDTPSPKIFKQPSSLIQKFRHELYIEFKMLDHTLGFKKVGFYYFNITIG
jgi:hypothetical protein